VGELLELTAAVKSNFLFSHLPDAKRQLLFDAMTRRAVTAGETIIKQGDRQGLTLVHFSAQPEPFMTQNTL